MPGPKEQNPDQVHRFLLILINELLYLWLHGILVRTPQHPEGRLMRVVLVGVCCNKPAAHKLGGFGSHLHAKFCTRCWISQKEKRDCSSFQEKWYIVNSVLPNIMLTKQQVLHHVLTTCTVVVVMIMQTYRTKVHVPDMLRNTPFGGVSLLDCLTLILCG